jgi:glycosyltransferase involved in cell wall biosynthesis
MILGAPLFLTNSLGGGGAERSTNVVINELLDLNISVELCIFDSTVPDLVVPKCNVIVFESSFKNRVARLLHQFFQFNSYLKAHRPKIVIANCALPELMVSFMFYRIPIIAVEHASQPWPRFVILGRLVRRLLRIRGTKWVKVSKHLEVWGLPKSFSVEINNPVVYRRKIKKLPIEDDIKRLVFIGRFSPEKNPQVFIQIARLSELPALMIGDGKLLESIRNQARLEKIQVDFAGHAIDPWSLVKRGDLLVIPSDNEGDGLVVIEALIHQRPFLLNSCPDLLRFGFPSQNYCRSEVDYVNTIKNLRNNLQVLAIPSSMSSEILEQRNPKTIAIKWLELFSLVMSIHQK